MLNTASHPTIRIKAYGAVLLSALIYGGNIIAGRLIGGTIPPITLSALRAVLALTLLFPVAWPVLKKTRRPRKKELAQLFVISLLSITVPYISLILGLTETTGTNASVILATLPAMTNILLFLICKTKPTKYQVAGILTSLLGLVIVFTQGDLLHLLSFRLGKGELFLLLNVFCISLFNIVGQGIMQKFSSLVTSVYSLCFATVTLIPLGLGQIHAFAWHLSLSGWLLVVYMGCGAAGIAYFLNLYSIDKIGSGQTSILFNMQHVFSICLSVLILKETLFPYHALGFLLVITGILLSLINPSVKPSQLMSD